MVWSQYVEDANAPAEECVGDYFDGDQEIEFPPCKMDIDDWTTWFSNDLMKMWMSLRQYREDASISNYIMPYATYSDFCDFCYQMSHGYLNSHPS